MLAGFRRQFRSAWSHVVVCLLAGCGLLQPPDATRTWEIGPGRDVESPEQVAALVKDGDRVVFDSWSIAEYLEETYPTLPIFYGPGGRAHALFINSWADSVLLGGIARFIVRDLLDVIDPKDQSYFRTSREARFGMSLEAVQAGRDDRVAGFRDTLLPLRLVLRRQKWLGGATPSYADHIIAGTLMWPRCVSWFALLAGDDPVAEWFGRMLDQYGGLGRNAKTP